MNFWLGIEYKWNSEWPEQGTHYHPKWNIGVSLFSYGVTYSGTSYKKYEYCIYGAHGYTERFDTCLM
jgi:hypothetical protein